MFYRGKHAARAWAGKVVIAAALAVGIGGGYAIAANAATIGITNNTAGVAGYYANDNGHTRFRDVQADTTVTPQIKNLNGVSNGALGVELCDPNSGYAAQLGVWWNGSQYQVVYAHGTFASAMFPDPCVMSGLITNTPQTNLFTGVTINQGDHLHFEVYYNPTSHWAHVLACDTTQDICRQQFWNDGYRQFWEAGIGAVSNSNQLTAPANILLDSFTNTSFNYYSSTRGWNSILVPAHWELKEANFVNSSSQTTMSPNESLDPQGDAFNLFEGSTSI